MELTNLPEEILIIIIQSLDLKTLESFYNTCKSIRNIICMQGVIKRANMSCNIMGTVKTLKLNFFKDISQHLIELNMRGVPDLTKTAIVPIFKKLKKLKVLDISYTNITIVDLIAVHQVCPTLKNISVNFSEAILLKTPKNVLLQCQLVFEHFEKIHFVGCFHVLLNSMLALFLVSKSKLRNLTFTISENCSTISVPAYNFLENVTFPVFDQFSLFLLNWQNIHTPYKGMSMYSKLLNEFPVLSMLGISNYEYILISSQQFETIVYASPIFNKFFRDNFNVTVEPKYDRLFGNVALMVWNRTSTIFNKHFYYLLCKQIKQYFPYCFEDVNLPAPSKYDWFYTRSGIPFRENYKIELQEIRKQRLAPPNCVLNYDTLFKEKQFVELSLEFTNPSSHAVTLLKDCDYLKKLTYLSLVGLGRFSSDFFSILFSSCDKLVTLNVQTLPVSPSAPPISRSIHLSRSLKNIRIVDRRINFEKLFHSFSKCPTLENIHITNQSSYEYNVLGNPDHLLEKCGNIYNIFIQALISGKVLSNFMQMFNKAKTRYNRNINVTLQYPDTNQFNYDPFLDIFRLSPIKSI